GGGGIGVEGRGDEPIGFSGLSALRLDRAEKIERVELIGQRLEHAGIDLLRLAQPSLLLQRHGLLQRLPKIWRRATGNRHRRGSHVSDERHFRACSRNPSSFGNLFEEDGPPGRPPAGPPGWGRGGSENPMSTSLPPPPGTRG